MRDATVIEMDGDYTLRLSWGVFPSATLVRGEDQVIGRKDWVMAGWNLPGPFSIHARINRWARKTAHRYEKMERSLAMPLRSGKR